MGKLISVRAAIDREKKTRALEQNKINDLEMSVRERTVKIAKKRMDRKQSSLLAESSFTKEIASVID